MKSGFQIEVFFSPSAITNWRRVPAKRFLQEVDIRSDTGEGELLGLSGRRGVVKRSEINQRASEAASYAGYKKVEVGHLVSNKMQAWNGIFGISPFRGITSPDYAVYRFTDDTERRFIEYSLRTMLYAAEFHCRSKGIGTGFLRLNPNQFLSAVTYLPDAHTQRAIADFLDRETGRIDDLIEKKQKLMYGIGEQIVALVDRAISDSTVPRIRYENAVSRVQRPVSLSEHDEFVRLGLYNRGRGSFRKSPADEEEMGDSDFFFVRSGDLILSGQFAWEGAVALASDDEDGCVVSHRYPIYRGRSGVSTAYLLGLFRSRFGDFLLNETSRGSAGRNRPLNTWRLGKEKIPIPNNELQNAVERAVALERTLKRKVSASIDRLREYRAALITAAVTGQIDVTSGSGSGIAARRLDAIQQEEQA